MGSEYHSGLICLSMCQEVLPMCQVNVAVAECVPGVLPWCRANVAEGVPNV